MNMREAFEKWFLALGYQQLPSSKTSFEAGYAAAIEAVKAEGPIAKTSLGQIFYTSTAPTQPVGTQLYKLPEDV